MPIGSLGGEVIEVVSLDEGAISYDEGDRTVTCDGGGRGFVRVRYRDSGAQKNQVQTIGVVCVNEIGDCTGLPHLPFDFEQYLEQETTGEADYLAQGNGLLYDVCISGENYTLQRPPPMPQLMYRVIDALGNGPYSLSDDDFPRLRNSVILPFSGGPISPPWISSVSREIEDLSIRPNGLVQFTAPDDCDVTVSCSFDPSLVQPGDILSISFGTPENTGFEDAIESSVEVTDAFVRSHIDLEWSRDTAELYPEARNMIVSRLIGMEVSRQALEFFDDLYSLSGSGIRVALSPFWQTRGRVTDFCHPDRRVLCEEIESMLAEHERELITSWRSDGYSLWYAEFLGYDDKGQYIPLSSRAPDFDAFEGVLVTVDTGRPLTSGDKPQAVADAVRSLAEELGPDQPVVLSAGAGPMQFAVDGVFCEAEVCTSAFSDYYSAYEKAVVAMLEAFEPGQVEGFGVALFDGGSHFDIREPYEERGGLLLNRVGETGFNSPLMNLFLAR